MYLVGAGPGDPGLLTLRGGELLVTADAIVYDALANPALLALASVRERDEPVELHAVGKRGGAPESAKQHEINELLIRLAREGKRVVRLKGGDPFVFGRGSEEAQALARAGIRFEVVPGVTAGIAAPAYAGIPVTHRRASTSVTFVTGREDPSDDNGGSVDWSALARAGGTIVLYMGVTRLPQIVSALVAGGMPASTPAAAVQWGTYPRQRTATATLGTLVSEIERVGLRPPVITVIGSVVSLRDEIGWFERRPLFGRRIVVTRSREQAGEFVEMLEERGAEAIMAPTIRIAPPEDGRPLDEACDRVSTYDWIVFTSANGVDHFMTRLLASHDVRDLKGVRICTVGPTTATHVQRLGIRVDLMPPEFRAEAIVDALAKVDDLQGRRILLPRADIARDVLADALRDAGAEVTDVTAYRTVEGSSERDSDQDLYRMLLDRQIDAVTFTSASTVRNFVNVIGRDQAADLLRSTVVASIGPVTAEAAQQLDIATTVMPARYTIPDLVDALVEYFTRNPGPDQARS